MAHTVQLGGPGLIVLVVLGAVIWCGSAYTAIDALRRRRTDFTGVAEGRWFYVVPQVVFLFAFIAWQVPFVQTAAPWVGWLAVGLPVALAQQMAYLLRVVFPTAGRLEERSAAERADGYVRPQSHERELADDRADAGESEVAQPVADEGFFEDLDREPERR